MNNTDRILVEAVKRAKTVTIIINEGDVRNKLTLRPRYNKRLHFEIGLALQTYYQTIEKERQNGNK